MRVHDGRVDPGSSITFVDDGSKDTTWRLIAEFHDKDERVKGIKLSRNRGDAPCSLAVAPFSLYRPMT